MLANFFKFLIKISLILIALSLFVTLVAYWQTAAEMEQEKYESNTAPAASDP